MATNTQDLTVDQGSSLTVTFTLTNSDGSAYDLTGYSAEAQVRTSYGASSVFIDATTANGKLTLGTPSLGVLTWLISPADLPSTIRFPSTDDDSIDYVYDLKLTSPTSKVYTGARGALTVNREVTHS